MLDCLVRYFAMCGGALTLVLFPIATLIVRKYALKKLRKDQCEKEQRERERDQALLELRANIRARLQEIPA